MSTPSTQPVQPFSGTHRDGAPADDSARYVDPPPPAMPAHAVAALRELLGQLPHTPADPPGSNVRSTVSVPGYEVLEELGRGGMGRVFKARQLRLGRLVALKVILAGPHADPDQLARFQNEARAAARLQHANIVQVHEVGEHDGMPYLALELVAGGSLAQRLNGAPLPPAAAAELVEILARAVEAAHAGGVVHRDLKPANVLLTVDGMPKIGDFGLAKQLDDATARTATGAILGTPSYMAPEQADGKGPEVGPLADVYALGAILYEAITGRPPFRAASVLETLEQVRHRDPMPPRQLQPGLPFDLQTICLKCLEKSPRRRYSSARDLADDLTRFRSGEPIHARPVGLGERLLKWTWRRPALATLVGGGSLAVLALLVGGWLYNTQLSAALRRAERNQARADAGYQSAQAAMRQMLARLSERNLAEVPQLGELQRQQYQDALAFYQEILKHQEDSDPAVRLDVAVAYRETAILQQQLGRKDRAEENYRQSVQVLEQLIAEHPHNDVYRGHLAAACNNLGHLMRLPDRKDESEVWHRRALTLREERFQRQPNDPTCRKDLAQSVYGLGALYHATGRNAGEHFARALELEEPLVRDHPNNPEYSASAADTYTAVSIYHAAQGRSEEAQRCLRRAEELLAPLVREHPETSRYTISLAAVRINSAYLLQKDKRLDDAAAWYDRAVADLQALVQREPNLREAKEKLLIALGGRAQALAGSGRFREAIPSWDRVLELGDKAPNYDLYRLEAILTVARAGDHLRTVAVAEEYLKREKIPSDWLCHLVCVYSRLSEAVAKNEDLSAAERVRLTEEYAARAVTVLARTHQEGYFTTPERFAMLREDPHLEPLRKRADYQELQQTIEKKR